MNVSIKKWIIVLFVVQLIIKLILSTSPYSSFDEREYIEFKNKTNAVPERAFLLKFLSYLFPSLLIGRIFVAIFSSFVVFILPFIKYKVVSKNWLLFTSLIVFNPLFLKLSSMYLTDALFFTFVIIFVYLKSKKMEKKASLISCISILIRFEGLLLVLINFIDLVLRRDKKNILIQFILLIFFTPVILKGIELYLTAHLGTTPEAPYFYYLVTPFMIQGLLFIFLPYALIKQFGKNRIIDLIFVSFIFFYLVFHIGGTFADRFRYVLPTLLASAYYISGIAQKELKQIILIFLIFNLFLLIPLYNYIHLREYIKELLKKALIIF